MIHALIGQGGKMATTTKHKLAGNQQPKTFAVETALLEVAKQMGNYAHAQSRYESAIKDRDTAKAVIDRLIPQLHKNRIKLGDLPRTGADIGYEGVKATPAQALTIGVYNAMPADISHAVKKNYLSALRVCIDENRKFTLNPAREKAKAKPKADDTKPSVGETAADNKQSLADVIRRNFKTLLANNPALAAELAEELAELAGI